MPVNNTLFDDVARVASGALGTLAGVRAEIEAQIRQQIERFLGQMDVVSRDEFEAVRAMAAKARAEQEELATRVANLEATLATLLSEHEGAPKRPSHRRAAGAATVAAETPADTSKGAGKPARGAAPE